MDASLVGEQDFGDSGLLEHGEDALSEWLDHVAASCTGNCARQQQFLLTILRRPPTISQSERHSRSRKMITLTSAQEAAFNAAGEAMTDLLAAGHKVHFMLNEYGEGDGRWSAWESATTVGSQPVWGSGPTPAMAVAACIAKVEEERSAPPKLRTAAEAVEAVRGLLKEEDPLRAKLDELPIA
jgi:hypothetical protein